PRDRRQDRGPLDPLAERGIMRTLYSSSKSSRSSPSQALLEFALALPILLMVIFGIVDFALLFQAWLSVENVARQTIRYAVTGEYDSAHCADGDDVGEDACAGDGKEDEVDDARL